MLTERVRVSCMTCSLQEKEDENSMKNYELLFKGKHEKEIREQNEASELALISQGPKTHHLEA